MTRFCAPVECSFDRWGDRRVALESVPPEILERSLHLYLCEYCKENRAAMQHEICKNWARIYPTELCTMPHLIAQILIEAKLPQQKSLLATSAFHVDTDSMKFNPEILPSSFVNLIPYDASELNIYKHYEAAATRNSDCSWWLPEKYLQELFPSHYESFSMDRSESISCPVTECNDTNIHREMEHDETKTTSDNRFHDQFLLDSDFKESFSNNNLVKPSNQSKDFRAEISLESDESNAKTS